MNSIDFERHVTESELRNLAACLYILGPHWLRYVVVDSIIQHLDLHTARKFKQWAYKGRGNRSYIRAITLNSVHGPVI